MNRCVLKQELKTSIYLSHIHYSIVIFNTSQLVRKFRSEHRVSLDKAPLQQKGLRALLTAQQC